MFGSIMVIKTLSGAQLKGMDQKKKQFYVEFYWNSIGPQLTQKQW